MIDGGCSMIHVYCPACGKRYAVDPQKLGKQARCQCGHTIKLQRDPTEKTAPVDSTPPASDTELPPSTSPIAAALMNREYDTQLSMLRERYLPLAMIFVGLTFAILFWFTLTYPRQYSLMTLGGLLLIHGLVSMPIALMSLSMVSRMLDTSWGPLFSTLLKLAAIVLGTGVAADALVFCYAHVQDGPDPWIPVMALGFYMLLCALPLKLLFDIDAREMAVTGLMLCLPRVLIILGASYITTSKIFFRL